MKNENFQNPEPLKRTIKYRGYDVTLVLKIEVKPTHFVVIMTVSTYKYNETLRSIDTNVETAIDVVEKLSKEFLDLELDERLGKTEADRSDLF